MNIPVLIVAVFTLLALIAHVTGGSIETASLKPTDHDGKKERSWKQAMCAFQMLTVDLAAVTGLLFLIALTDWLPFEYEITLLLSGLYGLWGISWLIQLRWLKSDSKTYFILPQWVFWFVGSALLYYGA